MLRYIYLKLWLFFVKKLSKFLIGSSDVFHPFLQFAYTRASSGFWHRPQCWSESLVYLSLWISFQLDYLQSFEATKTFLLFVIFVSCWCVELLLTLNFQIVCSCTNERVSKWMRELCDRECDLSSDGYIVQRYREATFSSSFAENVIRSIIY